MSPPFPPWLTDFFSFSCHNVPGSCALHLRRVAGRRRDGPADACTRPSSPGVRSTPRAALSLLQALLAHLSCSHTCIARTPNFLAHLAPCCRSKEERWKLTDFENWARSGEAAAINYVLRYTAPEASLTKAGRGGQLGSVFCLCKARCESCQTAPWPPALTTGGGVPSPCDPLGPPRSAPQSCGLNPAQSALLALPQALPGISHYPHYASAARHFTLFKLRLSCSFLPPLPGGGC